MKAVECKNCGSNEMSYKEGYMVCAYCGTKHQVTGEDVTQHAFGVAMSDDVMDLLRKCAQEPYNARRYANLILDIDPFNKEALKYL